MDKRKKKQSKFAHMLALLILHAEQLGYEVTMGDCYRDKRCNYGHKKSLHKLRLAVDLNLFVDGEYVTADEYHIPLHQYWTSIGGAEPIMGDMNHYSVEHKGLR